MKRPATACTLVCTLACSLWLSCAGSGNPKDADARIPLPDGDVHIILPDVQLAPIDTTPANPEGCHCTVIASPCPAGATSCLDCTGSPAWCSQCPPPTDPPRACDTLFFHCDYPQAGCDCLPTDGGTGVWSCWVCPC